MPQTASFAPPSSASDRLTREAVTAEKVALSGLTWTGAWSQRSSNLQSELELTRQCRPCDCNWARPPSALWKKTERLSGSRHCRQGHATGHMICCVYHRALTSSYHGSASCCCAEVGCEMLRTLDYVLQEINQIIWCRAVKVELCPRSCILHYFVQYWRHRRSVTARTARPSNRHTPLCVEQESSDPKGFMLLLFC